jgi:hypothetical protein
VLRVGLGPRLEGGPLPQALFILLALSVGIFNVFEFIRRNPLLLS